MFGLSKITIFALSVVSVLGAVTLRDEESLDSAADPASSLKANPVLFSPTLAQIRDILAQLEAPIISALTERLNLVSDPNLYANGGKQLQKYFKPLEQAASDLGRYNYGKLEYPYTIKGVAADKTTKSNVFPPGRFHQDSFSPNPDLFSWYTNTLAPLFSSSNSYYYHLDNSSLNDEAALSLDVTILRLLSHRSSIGKIVAESKYSANVTGYTPLIQAQDSTTIRVLLTNVTQEGVVLAQAATAANAFSSAWVTSGALVSPTFASKLLAISQVVFRELIDVTTNVEIQYLLQRFN